jgi:TPR repeat protein
MIVDLGDKAHWADVLPLWEQACEKGSFAGCEAAGATLTVDPDGLGTPRDMARGRAYLAKACAAHFLPACSGESTLVVRLKETEKYAAAHAQLLEACNQRDREACHFLGQQELAGTFGPRDELSAGRHFWQSCYDDWGPGCAALAYMQQKGIATPVDPDKAKRLTERACVLEYAPSCEALRHPERDLPAQPLTED